MVKMVMEHGATPERGPYIKPGPARTPRNSYMLIALTIEASPASERQSLRTSNRRLPGAIVADLPGFTGEPLALSFCQR